MSLIDDAKEAAKLVKQTGNFELYEKFVSMMSAVEENLQLKEEVRALKEEREELKKRLDIDSDMEYEQDGGFYVRKSEKATGKPIPYCPLCWRADKTAVPLNPGSGDGFYRCEIHKSFHEAQAYRDRNRRPDRTARFSGSPWS